MLPRVSSQTRVGHAGLESHGAEGTALGGDLSDCRNAVSGELSPSS